MSNAEVNGLSFGYDERVVLERVSFTVARSEILTILGPNGSGKTTLLKCLNKLLKPKGSILIDSFDITRLHGKELAKLIGYVPQAHSPAFPYKVIDVIMSGLTPYLGFSTPGEEDYKAGYDILNQLGLEHMANRRYTQISGGELRLVLIARALLQRPKVILLDEPTSHLDIKNKVLILKVLKNITNEGIIVINSEHDPNLAFMMSDEVLLMNSGKILDYGKTESVLTKANLSTLYGIDIEIIESSGSRYISPVL